MLGRGILLLPLEDEEEDYCQCWIDRITVLQHHGKPALAPGKSAYKRMMVDPQGAAVSKFVEEVTLIAKQMVRDENFKLNQRL